MTSNAGTLLVHVDSLKTTKKARRRRRSQLRNANVHSSSSDEENYPVARRSRNSSKTRSFSSVEGKNKSKRNSFHEELITSKGK